MEGYEGGPCSRCLHKNWDYLFPISCFWKIPQTSFLITFLEFPDNFSPMYPLPLLLFISTLILHLFSLQNLLFSSNSNTFKKLTFSSIVLAVEELEESSAIICIVVQHVLTSHSFPSLFPCALLTNSMSHPQPSGSQNDGSIVLASFMSLSHS